MLTALGWKLRAVLVFEANHGPVPHGHVVHHINRDTLDDRPENLQSISRADHLREHRAEFEGRRLEGLRASNDR